MSTTPILRITIHRARVVLPVSAPPVVDGAVAVDAAGGIHDVGTFSDVRARLVADAPAGAVEIREWDGVLTPGLVNAHTHLQYTEMAAVGASPYAGFVEWAREFGRVYELDHDWADSAADGAAQLLRSGTTAAADIVTDPIAGGALFAAGLRGVAYWEVFAWKTDRWHTDGGREETLELVRGIPTDPARGLHAGLSPHALYSVDTGVFRDLAVFAEQLGLRQHIHAAEAESEDEYARTGTGTLAARWHEFGHGDLELLRGGGSGLGAIGYLDSLGSLTPTTHVAHGVYVDAADRVVLRERGVTVALCPRSNAIIGLDAAPVAAYLREGNPIAVGTDSLGSSPSLDLLDDVAALVATARSQGYADRDLHARLLHAATLGGARALGLDAGDVRIGALAPGARGDLAVFDIAATDPEDALVELVEGGGGRALATLLDGRVVADRSVADRPVADISVDRASADHSEEAVHG